MLNNKCTIQEKKSIGKYIEKCRNAKKFKNKLIGLSILTVVMISIGTYSIIAITNDNKVSNSIIEINNPLVNVIPTAIEVKNIKKVVQIKKVAQTKEDTIYNDKIPMAKEHQEYLYKMCKERNLNYKKALAVIKHESVFDSNNISDRDYGYFQINTVNHQDLSDELKTENAPLNPFVNIDWGTYMLSELYEYWGNKGYSGDTLDEYVWSSYNKGLGGFREHGKAISYIGKVRTALIEINSIY